MNMPAVFMMETWGLGEGAVRKTGRKPLLSLLHLIPGGDLKKRPHLDAE